jgi:DNA-binding NarL/FixJ family response regulator
MSQTTQILVIDDHPLVREAAGGAIRAVLPETSIFEADTVAEAWELASRQTRLDMIVLDLVLPGVSGLDGLIAIRSHFPRVPVLLFTALEDARIANEALALGASAYVPKTACKATFVEAVMEVLRGENFVPEPLAAKIQCLALGNKACNDIAKRVCNLSRSQLKVLQLIRQGLLNKQIAHELGVGETTVKAHVTAILRKLQVASRTQIVIETSHLDFEAILKGAPPCEAGLAQPAPANSAPIDGAIASLAK